MADKTMPERILAWGGGAHAGWDDAALTDQDGDTEYVRADIAAGDPNEPLEDGQYRWVGIMFSSEQWEVAQVFSLGGDFVFQVGRLSHRKDTVAKIGPVIRPPADTAN